MGLMTEYFVLVVLAKVYGRFTGVFAAGTDWGSTGRLVPSTGAFP